MSSKIKNYIGHKKNTLKYSYTSWFKKSTLRKEIEVLLIISTQRSSSTLLFDLLRYQEKIGFLESAEIFKRLKIDGRRYPFDLSYDHEIAGFKKIIVSRDGKTSWIPKDVDSKNTQCFIEKLHPHFYKWKDEKFLNNLAQLKKKVKKVNYIYLSRDPVSSIRSLISYQERNPDWYSHLNTDKLLLNLLKDYKGLLSIKNKEEGLYIDFDSLHNERKSMLKRIDHFYPNLLTINDDLLNSFDQKFGKETRKTQNENFVGKNDNFKDSINEKLNTILTENKMLITELNSVYNALQL